MNDFGRLKAAVLHFIEVGKEQNKDDYNVIGFITALEASLRPLLDRCSAVPSYEEQLEIMITMTQSLNNKMISVKKEIKDLKSTMGHSGVHSIAPDTNGDK